MKTKVICRCHKCDFQTESVYDLDVMAAHLWEEHAYPTLFKVNGETIKTGPWMPCARFLLRWFNG